MLATTARKVPIVIMVTEGLLMLDYTVFPSLSIILALKELEGASEAGFVTPDTVTVPIVATMLLTETIIECVVVP